MNQFVEIKQLHTQLQEARRANDRKRVLQIKEKINKQWSVK